MSSSQGQSTSGMPRLASSRLPPPSVTARRAVPSATASTSRAPINRAPMTNATNRPGSTATARPGSAGKTISSTTTALRKPAATAGATARRVASSSASLRASTGSNSRRQSDEDQSPAIADIEAKLAAMAEMFDRERSNTEAQMLAEKSERKKYEEKVQQLEENLEEQRRLEKEQRREVGRRRTIFDDEMAMLRQQHAREKQMWTEDLERERMTIKALKDSMTQNSTMHLTLESTNAALRTEVQSLQDQVKSRDLQLQSMEGIVQSSKQAVVELENDLREAESLRRKLHNEVQELRGNIRVFARIRPALSTQAATQLATIRLPNPKEAKDIEILSAGESATGTATMKTHGFTFDRVFGPAATQRDVFQEVEHLVQSTLDGFNTCIFAYGQTGSGKTHTLEGSGLPDSNFDQESNPLDDSGAGLIPRAVQMLFLTAESLQDKGWTYAFEGSMLEIYNETINDLLGKGKFDQVKHEIKHENNGRTTVSEAVVLPLSSPSQVFALLARASSKRSVAATLMNERSSRSHSVFSLRVQGRNATTGESCDATLSLVDLAGSERLVNSGSGDDATRRKEAVHINKSLSSLGDVISSLGNSSGNPKAHIPYRNSTLTWLLKNSLGGNSKTLMLLALSPMQEHLNESLTSLRFASKVNSTVIGTAHKVKAGGATA